MFRRRKAGFFFSYVKCSEGEKLALSQLFRGKKADFFPIIIPLLGMFGSGIRIWGSADPYPSEIFTDPKHWFRRIKVDVGP